MKREIKILEREFKKITGRPFLPSPKDIALLMNWLEKGFPLPAIIDGIKIGWEKKKRRNPTISSFRKEIEKAIISYKESIVGRRGEEPDKDSLMIEEIKNFLKFLPPELEFTEVIFKEAIKTLNSKKREAEKMRILEKLETELEEILINRFSKEGDSPNRVLRNLRLNYKIPRLLRYFY